VADEPSNRELRELRNLIERNYGLGREQITALINQINDRVLTKVYEADERARTVIIAAALERVTRLEDERADIRRGSRAALTAAVVAVFSAIATVVINALIKG
jgi:RNase H-fold protein (predicted Holliday junction resolvase)